MKIMLKFTTICIFRVWTLSVQSLFLDLLLERVRHAFFKIWVPIGAPSGAPFDGNGGIVVGYRFHVFFNGFRKSSPCVGGDSRPFGALNSRPQTADLQPLTAGQQT